MTEHHTDHATTDFRIVAIELDGTLQAAFRSGNGHYFGTLRPVCRPDTPSPARNARLAALLDVLEQMAAAQAAAAAPPAAPVRRKPKATQPKVKATPSPKRKLSPPRLAADPATVLAERRAADAARWRRYQERQRAAGIARKRPARERAKAAKAAAKKAA